MNSAKPVRPTLIANGTRRRHHARSHPLNTRTPRREFLPVRVPGMIWELSLRRRGFLRAVQEIQLHAAHFDQIPVVEFGGAPDFNSIDFWNAVPAPQIIPVLVLVDLCGNVRREPAAEPDRG